MNNSNLEEKINHHVTEVVQGKWEKDMEDTGISKLAIPEEYVAIMRVCYQLGYQGGQTDTFNEIKDIFNNDIDAFQEMFDDDEL